MTEEYKQLNDYGHTRLRTEMYLGSRDPHIQNVLTYANCLTVKDSKPEIIEQRWVPALYTAFREIIDNALDEIIGRGYGNQITVNYNEQNFEFSVEDNGRGIPIEYSEKYQNYIPTMVLSKARAGSNFGDRGELAGTNGIGAAATNFCSEHFEVEIVRDNKKFVQTFRENLEGDELIQSQPIITPFKSKSTYTKITFKLSSAVFKNLILPTQFVKDRIQDIALANPGLKIVFNGETIKIKNGFEKILFDKSISVVIERENFKSCFYLVPDFHTGGEFIHTTVNNIPAFDGGVHVDQFKKSFYSGLLAALEKTSRRRGLNPNRLDISENLLIYNITKMKAPNFNSQSKTRLINEESAVWIEEFFKNPEIFNQIIKRYPDWIESIYRRCEIRTQKKDAGDLAKSAKKLLKSKVPNLKDAVGKDRTKCVLVLAEGESAIEGISEARDPEIYGGLGLRGKVLNVNGVNPKHVIDDKTLSSIMASTGLVVGQPADRNRMYYGKIYIAHDSDPDGFNIGALLINFFYSYWPELFDPKLEPVFYVYNTPYIIAKKTNNKAVREYWYSNTIDQFDPSVYNKENGWIVTRAKGLGTLEKIDWVNSLANPVLTPILDTDGDIKPALDLIFNNKRADDRKDWISLNDKK